jgi:thiol-disulfide isomerase/thioredoxin
VNRRTLIGQLGALLSLGMFGGSGRAWAMGGQVNRLPMEGEAPSLDRATTWLNSSRPSRSDLLGKVVLVDFWTYSCINWRRSLPYVRAWAQKYHHQGLVVIGAHAPEFQFETVIDNVRHAARDMNITYPIAIDNEYQLWDGFESLLTEAGVPEVASALVSVEGAGAEASPDYANLKSPENYLGYARSERFVSTGHGAVNEPCPFTAPARLGMNHWALAGIWMVGAQSVTLMEPGGCIAYAFHARDLHLVMAPSAAGRAIRFRITLEGQPPGEAHGLDVDAQGYGLLNEPRLYQLVRQPAPVTDRLFAIEFLDGGAEAFSFTFG